MDAGVKIDRVLCGQLATSEAYARKNMNRTHEELFKEAEKSVKFLHSAGVKSICQHRHYIRMPYTGRSTYSEGLRIRGQGFFDIGFDEIEHSDPDGIAAPDAVYEYFSNILKKYPDTGAHSFHAHDIKGNGTCFILCGYGSRSDSIRYCYRRHRRSGGQHRGQYPCKRDGRILL